jgi:hypothetical protein
MNYLSSIVEIQIHLRSFKEACTVYILLFFTFYILSYIYFTRHVCAEEVFFPTQEYIQVSQKFMIYCDTQHRVLIIATNTCNE